MSLNQVIISGRLPRDPDLQMLNSGTGVCRFTVAVKEAHWTPEKGDHVLTHWISVVAWGELAESVGERYRRGDEVVVQGQLVQEELPAKGDKKPEKKTRIRALTVAGVRKGRQGDPNDIDPDVDPPF